MKWLDRLNKCLDYIEDNLDGEIEISKLLSIACLCRTHFNRMFDAVTGMTIAAYIKNRRMTKAVFDLQQGQKVIDVAMNYGYSSSESFSRAFKSFHGISPSQVFGSNHRFASYSKLNFHISIKGDTKVNYRIESREEFKVMGKSIITKDTEGENNTDIIKFWQEIMSDGTLENLSKASRRNNEEDVCYGICFPCVDNKSEFRYVIAVPHTQDNNGFETYTVPASRWAIFECVGPLPKTMQDMCHNIYSEWLPSVDYEINGSVPDVEMYTDGNSSEDDYLSEIWLPIK